ncbi:hypothetical protein BUALT_Bualt08G0147100 [Buddleja alternifolia]|uniref:BHLH domain-containing protein n=1 Tax=Buddleja alternifolia TaxID=168488 RepID=A0AAV6XH99_9LAMI|nr:hypothetical protein BUALT_Bualt08G0147100 [Buddleja alternifolia]
MEEHVHGEEEEIFDLNPILPEIYNATSHEHLFSINSNISHPEACNHASSRSSANSTDDDQLLIMNNSITYHHHSLSSTAQQLISSKPSSSASTSKLISFESSNTASLSLIPATNPQTPYGSSMIEMSSTPQIIKFSSSAEDDDFGGSQYSHDAAHEIRQKSGFTATRTLLQAQDHVMAERKRREKLGQLFISLSKAVPGLKKLDKASLLEDAINHLKTLQERLRVLEEEDVVRNNRSSIDNYNSTAGSTSTHDQSAAPEIKARISNRNVLISICCDKQKGLISRIPYEMEKMHLTVVDMRAMPFGGGAALYITILAEVLIILSLTTIDDQLNIL